MPSRVIANAMAERDEAIDENAVRLTAYFLWEQDGRPEGGAELYWWKALEKHREQLRYDHWLGEEIRGDRDEG